MTHPIHILDLNFQGTPGTIASYLIPHSKGGILIESGPGSTLPGLEAALAQHGLTTANITDVFVTHIHLDHAGASGHLARKGARIHVHPVGAPHLLNPEKLLRSARRIYGEMMDPLWGEFLPVPQEQLHATKNGETIEINGVHVRVIETPGHAYHHNVYLIDQVCFTGDICGVRLAGLPHLRLPTPPPEFHLETWRESLRRLRREHIAQLALTHFGLYNNVEWHFQALENALAKINHWMEEVMPNQPALETLRQQIVEWERERATADGLDAEAIQALETANPAWMAADGLARYWHKYRETSA